MKALVVLAYLVTVPAVTSVLILLFLILLAGGFTPAILLAAILTGLAFWGIAAYGAHWRLCGQHRLGVGRG